MQRTRLASRAASKRHSKGYLGWVYFLSLLPFCLVLIGREGLYAVGREDGITEYLGALCFLGAGIILIFAALNGRRLGTLSPARRRMLWLWAVLCIYAFGEEISWGQRIIGFETPAWLGDVNYQGETNLHNIGVTDQYKGTLLYTLSRFPLAAMALGVLFIAIPVMNRFWLWAQRWLDRLGVPVFPLYIGGVWFCTYVALKIAELYMGGLVGYDPNWAREIWETVSAALIALATTDQLRQSKG